jgi:hypothetical protein
MTSKSDSCFTGWLLAGLILSSAAAQAANGFSISTSQENAVTIGMSASEVLQLLGRPERTARYANVPGPTWTYNVIGAIFGKTEFNIDFSADEKVISKGEWLVGGVGVGGM